MSGAIVQKSLISMQTSYQVAPLPWRDRVQLENEDFYRQLECFPSMLNVPGYRNINTNRWCSVRDRVEAERGQGGGTVMELSRDANLVAFALFQLKKFQQALDKTKEVLEMDGLNLVANANRSTLLWNMGDKPTAREQIAHLKKLKEQAFFGEREVEGIAEIAYCCSRLGPAYDQLTVQYFEEVVEQRPEEMDWKLGMAIALQRSLYTNSRMCHAVDTDNALKMGEKAAMLLHEVQGSNAPDFVKALAAAKLGCLLIYRHLDLKKKLGGVFESPEFPRKCIQIAESLAPTNVSVLTECGQFYLQFNKNEARRLLQKSVDIRPTAKALLKLGQLCESSRQNQNALRHFEKCVEISYGESTQARFFIAKMHKRKNNLLEALHECEQILIQDKSLNSPLDQIKAYEMAGLVYLQMDTSPSQPNTKEKGLQLLEQALYMQSHNSVTNPELTRHLQSRGYSFKILLDAICQDSSLSPVEKLKRKARLYYIIGDEEQAVDELSKVPDEERLNEASPDILEMDLRCLIKTKDYMSALYIVAYLDATGKLENFRGTGKTDLPVLVYVFAGQRRLMMVGNWINFDFYWQMAQNSFLWAFDYMFPRATLADQPAKGARDSDAWHVTILHDPQDKDVAQAAQSVKVILTKACGLRVTCMSDDVHPGCTELFGVLEQADNCRLLMVVLGNTEPSEEFLCGYLAPCLSPTSLQTDKAPRLFVVQIQQGSQLPRVLCGYPFSLCPSELVSRLPKSGSLYFTETEINAICSFFCAMLGVDGIEQYLTK
ncbi:uncharacterized protein [Littorina saxatilis]|uniref:Uncharacterized protein n=1 Tax=Littorina saxatilis TaxID=31220 RepID=A0AAN9GPL3_9CAEN